MRLSQIIHKHIQRFYHAYVSIDFYKWIRNNLHNGTCFYQLINYVLLENSETCSMNQTKKKVFRFFGYFKRY